MGCLSLSLGFKDIVCSGRGGSEEDIVYSDCRAGGSYDLKEANLSTRCCAWSQGRLMYE